MLCVGAINTKILQFSFYFFIYSENTSESRIHVIHSVFFLSDQKCFKDWHRAIRIRLATSKYNNMNEDKIVFNDWSQSRF